MERGRILHRHGIGWNGKSNWFEGHIVLMVCIIAKYINKWRRQRSDESPFVECNSSQLFFYLLCCHLQLRHNNSLVPRSPSASTIPSASSTMPTRNASSAFVTSSSSTAVSPSLPSLARSSPALASTFPAASTSPATPSTLTPMVLPPSPALTPSPRPALDRSSFSLAFLSFSS